MVLTHYLATLRERNELDALLPELLVAMGHNVLSRAQVGVPQGGVDVLSSLAAPDGPEEAFLFIIKFGDIGREDLYAGAQSIQPSVREASTEYVQNRLPANLRGGRKRLIVLSNGEWKQAAQAGFKVLSDEVATQAGCSLEFWGIDQLATLIEAHLLDESLLLKAGRDHLRAAIATLDDSHAAERSFRRFVDDVLDGSSAGNSAARRRAFLKRCAAAEMGWAVFDMWGQSESNLKPSVAGGEYLLLKIWSEAVGAGLDCNAEFLTRFEGFKVRLWLAMGRYSDKVWPQLQDPYAVMGYAGHEVLYNRLVLEEAGRLGLLLLSPPHSSESQAGRTAAHERLVALLNAHQGARLPALDGQAIDLSLALAGLMSEGDFASVDSLVMDVADRLVLAARDGRLLPVTTDLVEDAIALRAGDVESGEVCRTSTLVPMLAAVAAFVDNEVALHSLRETLRPLMPEATLERWFPKAEIDQIAARRPEGLPGVSRGLRTLGATCAAEAAAAVALPPGAAAPGDVTCVARNQAVVLALSARVFRHPLPSWFLEQFRRPSAPPVGAPAPTEPAA
ncbi:hypothetical protein C1930_00555 [Stenotrophomonas sp. SAU14A_NAIMI4_8]|nr:hypothetical protein C1930_00555 [Stenotrophomonas sp. SAU14A_NAIMI4_8]